MASQTTSPRQVFISHATQDADFAHRLADGLKQLGVPVWIAPDSIHPSEDWVEAIERGLGESSHMLVVLTPAALKSHWVKKETNVAIALEGKGRIKILPLDVKACDVPLLLSSYQMVSFRQNYDAGFAKLVGASGLSAAPPGVVSPPHEAPQPVARPSTRQPRLKAQVAQPTAPERPIEPELVLIPAGEFLMGSDPEKDKDARDNEQPQHKLYLPDYTMAKTPVTNAQYAAFVKAAGHEPPEHWKGGKPPQGKEDHPVVNVTWYDAMAYCKWLAEATGKPYRLPSEAEWEKAARGTDGRIYPWGNEWDAKRCNTGEGGKVDTTPVGSYPQGASPYGLLDMAGNVWELTLSLHRPYPYQSDDGREDLSAQGSRVLRGGSWYYSRGYARVSYRNLSVPGHFFSDVGFRVVVAPV
jgi:formylglycine-generating enzyme required for sulfatase activity